MSLPQTRSFQQRQLNLNGKLSSQTRPSHGIGLQFFGVVFDLVVGIAGKRDLLAERVVIGGFIFSEKVLTYLKSN